MSKYELIKISGVVVGVGFNQTFPDGSGTYSERICETLFDSGNDKRDAADSKKWATIICDALNKSDQP